MMEAISNAPTGMNRIEWVNWRCSSIVNNGSDEEPRKTSASGTNAAKKPIREAILNFSLSETHCAQVAPTKP